MQVQSHLNRKETTEKFENYQTVKGGCIPSKNEVKTQKRIKLRCLASYLNFRLLQTGCPIAYGSLLNFMEFGLTYE